MKKISIILGSFLFFTIANGQIEEGTLLVGGQLSGSSSDAKYINATGGSFYPETSSKSIGGGVSISKAFKKNDVYGVYLGYSNLKETGNYVNGLYQLKFNFYGAGVFRRKYYKLFSSLSFFNQIGVDFYFNKTYLTDSIGSPNIPNGFSGDLFFTPGVAYRIYKKVDLELLIPSLIGLSYSNNNSFGLYETYNSVTQNNSLELKTNLSFASLAAGIRIIL